MVSVKMVNKQQLVSTTHSERLLRSLDVRILMAFVICISGNMKKFGECWTCYRHQKSLMAPGECNAHALSSVPLSLIIALL